MEETRNISSTVPSVTGRVGGWALLLLAIAAVLSGCWLLYWFECGRIADQQKQRENTRAGLLTLLMRSELKPLASNLRLLADGDGLRNYMETGRAEGLQAATRRAQFISTSHPDYDQVRYIDEHGQEIVRVNRGGEVVPREQLQNKADRAYFQRAMTLPAGSLYLSAMDLNIENGRIEMPPKPMLRMAVPVFDAAGHHRGIYIINLLAADLIDYLQKAIPSSGQRLRILNPQGYWLKGDDPAHEWGFAFPERAQFTLAQSDPGLWAQIQQQPSGQAGDDHLFTWLRMSPTDMTGEPASRVMAEQPWLLMASEVSPPEWSALFDGVRNILRMVAPALVLFTLLSAWLLRARRKMLAELRAVNQSLEQRVHERTVELAHSYEALQYREALLEETGHLAKVGGWEFDPVTGEGDWTPEIARIHDLEETLKPSKEMGLQFYPGESGKRIEAAVQKSLADGTPYDLELEFVSAKGTRKWVRTISRPVMQDGRVVRMRGALQDVTERKQSELRLHAQLQRMNLLERTTRLHRRAPGPREHPAGGDPHARRTAAAGFRLRVPVRRAGARPHRDRGGRGQRPAGGAAVDAPAGAHPHRRERAVTLRARPAGVRGPTSPKYRSPSRSGLPRVDCMPWWPHRCRSRARCSAC